MQRSMVFVRKPGLTVGSGAPPASMLENSLDGLPKSVTAAMRSPTAGGSADVDSSVTDAPCEYPPTTMLVLGQLATVD